VNLLRWYEDRRLRRWNEDCAAILSELRGEMSSHDLWIIVKRPFSSGKLHLLLDAMESFGFIESRSDLGGRNRGWRDRRMVRITASGQFFLKELGTANAKRTAP